MESTVKKQIPFGRPMIGPEELQAVQEVLSGPILVHGPRTEQFETAFADFIGGGSAVAVSSCTAALHLACLHLQLGPGDEVLVPAQTHTATAHAVELCGATPVFVDAEADTGNMDLDALESAVTARTRALLLVHFLGMPVDMDRLRSVADKHELAVIEDCALAIGTRYRDVHAGLLGDIGCFSFYPVKHMTTAEGGMLVTRHPGWAEEIALKRAFGVDRHMAQRKIPGEYDVIRLGLNYRLNEIQCAIGIEQIKRIDGFLAARKRNYQRLSARLAEMDELTQFRSSHGPFRSSCYCLSVLLTEALAARRIEIIESLKRRGVGTSIYYPRPVPMLTYYRQKYGFQPGRFPVAERISSASIALPVGPHLDEEDMDCIAETLKHVICEVK